MMDGWFGSIRADGAVARGSQRITVNGEDFGVGIAPAWFDHETLVIKDFDDRLYKLNVTTGERLLLTSHQVQEHAAGGGVWAYSFPPIIHTAVGRDGSIAEVYEHGGNNRDRSILLNGKEIHRGIVNNAMTEGGYVTWSRYEPREVWGRSPDGQTRKLADGLFGLPIMTPDGAWALIQTHTELLVLPWGASDCQIIRTGNDNNFYPDALWVGGIILAVWNTHDGQPGLASIDITAEREPLPGTPTEPPTEPDMSIPNRKDVLERVDAEHPHLIQMNTPNTVREFYWRGGWALFQADPNFGFLSKSAGENGHEINGQRVSVDAYAYKGSDEVVDALSSAGDGPGTGGLSWSLDERRPSNVWVQPTPFPGSVPPPQPAGKHAYEGGDNDTGECDYVDRNGDTCRQPPSAEIHQGVTEPPDPPDPIPGGVTNADIMAQLKALSAHLGLR